MPTPTSFSHASWYGKHPQAKCNKKQKNLVLFKNNLQTAQAFLLLATVRIQVMLPLNYTEASHTQANRYYENRDRLGLKIPPVGFVSKRPMRRAETMSIFLS